MGACSHGQRNPCLLFAQQKRLSSHYFTVYVTQLASARGGNVREGWVFVSCRYSGSPPENVLKFECEMVEFGLFFNQFEVI